jgi:UDPglucose--hexose-1-phosphate uridylyltransferase
MRQEDRPTTARSHEPRIHRDPLSGRTVFVAPDRASRPIDASFAQTSLAQNGPHRAEGCPFCAGNERLTPPDRLRVRGADGGWLARIVPNLYPVVREPGAATARGGGGTARGVHEVVVESPRHENSILAIDPYDWRQVWRLCRDRLAMLAADRDLAWATIFKNSGPLAGASLEHVHSQIVALDFVPASIHAELIHAEASTDAFESLVREAEAGGRIVATHGDLVALSAPAPRQPFETWIVSRQDHPTFSQAPDADADALAELTQWTVRRLQRVVPGADYNWWLHQAPFAPFGPAANGPTGRGYRWHLEIVPRLASLAGFELGTGCHITTLAPEAAAEILREA